MSDYNWKSCSNPANAARLRELLAAKRNIIGRFDGGTIGYLDVEIIPEVFIFRKVFFLDPDEPAQMRARIAYLESEIQRLIGEKDDQA